MYTPKDIYIYTLKELLMYIKKWTLYVSIEITYCVYKKKIKEYKEKKEQ